MKDKQKSIYTVKVTYKADITLTVESDNADDAIRLASDKAKTADNSEFNIYDEMDVSILDFATGGAGQSPGPAEQDQVDDGLL